MLHLGGAPYINFKVFFKSWPTQGCRAFFDSNGSQLEALEIADPSSAQGKPSPSVSPTKRRRFMS
jgi:hypothetical protein